MSAEEAKDSWKHKDTIRLDWLDKAGSYPKMLLASKRLIDKTKGAGPFPAHSWRDAIDAAMLADHVREAKP